MRGSQLSCAELWNNYLRIRESKPVFLLLLVSAYHVDTNATENVKNRYKQSQWWKYIQWYYKYIYYIYIYLFTIAHLRLQLFSTEIFVQLQCERGYVRISHVGATVNVNKSSALDHSTLVVAYQHSPIILENRLPLRLRRVSAGNEVCWGV